MVTITTRPTVPPQAPSAGSGPVAYDLLRASHYQRHLRRVQFKDRSHQV